jgi:Fe2+ or Zn2+ uptake regulation protein
MPNPDEQSTYETRAVAALKANGYRITMPRLLIIRALSATEARNGYALAALINSSGGRLDVVSVYRNMPCFIGVGIAAEIGMAGGYVSIEPDAMSRGSAFLVNSETSAVAVATDLFKAELSSVRATLEFLDATATIEEVRIEVRFRR